MKAYLMDRDRDFDLEQELPANAEDVTQDLELTTLLAAMAGEDKFVFEVAQRAIFASLTDSEAIAFRQHVLADCLAQPAIVRALYNLAVEAIVREKKVFVGFFRDSPDTLLSRAVQVLELFVVMLKRLRQMADEHAGVFRSEGFVRLFAMLSEELSDDYFQIVEEHLQELKLNRGVQITAQLGEGNKGSTYVLRRAPEQSWLQRLSPVERSGYSFRIADRDDAGFRALSELRGQGVNLVANALSQSTDHILSFFAMLRTELAFYVGCLNLQEQLAAKGEPTCFPLPVGPGEPALSARGLYDVCLSLHLNGRAVGNAVDADSKELVMITGANQGGKSTFLRSVGLAQLMMQSGMMVGAESFRANVCSGVFTHYKREEDTSMESGKLDEELSRMSVIADRIRPHALLLCNESFASTNEREGSEIARQIVRALLEADVKVVFVTHMYDLAGGFYQQGLESALFLRAERREDGQRTFKLVPGEPLPTSYGEDSYRRIFGPERVVVPEPALS